MSGEGKSVSFRRTEKTAKSNQELLEDFQKIIYRSRVVMHMKWYGKDRSVDILEYGDPNRQEWEQKYVPIEGTFQFEISVYDSWYEDADLYESHDREDSFVSLARDFAKNNDLMYFPRGYPAEWYEKNEQGQYQHYKVHSKNKKIDKIYQIWHHYGIMALQAFDEELESQLWSEAQEKIKPLMIA